MPSLDTGSAFSRILGWMEAGSLGIREHFRPPASRAALANYRAAFGLPLPDSLVAMLSVADGTDDDGDFFLHRLLGVEEIIAIQTVQERTAESFHRAGVDCDRWVHCPEPGAVSRKFWKPGWVPFTADDGDCGFAVDTSPGPFGTAGQVITYGPDPAVRAVIAQSLAGFFELISARLDLGSALVDPHTGAVSLCTPAGSANLIETLMG
ncbi:SMI1/KNR4 family protein [Nocardia sp. CA-145437]|uniref:SMI1/KNR4 family protein n=1 Tax=Nocardia sp. CA-145437 TaxID=3239980 RepID=UPI003D98246B